MVNQHHRSYGLFSHRIGGRVDPLMDNSIKQQRSWRAACAKQMMGNRVGRLKDETERAAEHCQNR
jgi:hypothetical protein